jgi:3D (Asp-Asp-Asp) domain-containing protein
MKNTIKKLVKQALVIRLILAILVMSVVPAQASAAFLDFGGISSWFKSKASSPISASEIAGKIEYDLITVKGVALVSANQSLIGVSRVYETIVTAYSSSVNETDDTPFITASGERVRDGIVAANFLPFGTRIRIPEVFGNKIFVVKDRMATKHAEKVDIWFETKELAKTFGKKKLIVEVLDSGAF